MNLKTVFKAYEDYKVIDTYELWYDWFCTTNALNNRGKVLLQKLYQIRKSTKFDSEKTYVFFKNNCPCNFGLYDDFRICNIESGEVLYTVIPSMKDSDKAHAELWGLDNNFNEPIVYGTWKDIKDWFLKCE